MPIANPQRRAPALFAIALAGLCAGCREGVEPAGPGPKPDTLRIVDTLTVRETIHDTVAPPLGACSYRAPAASDTLAGDFAPLAVGNEWVYDDSSSYWSTSGVYSWNTNRRGKAVIKVIGTECDGGNLTHFLRFEFEGTRRNTQYDQRHELIMDSTGRDFHTGSLRCSDDGSLVACEGLDYFDVAYAGIFKFHQASIPDLQEGIDPFTGRTAERILYTGNPPGIRRILKGVGTLEFRIEGSSGATCCGFGHTYRASLVSFNGVAALYR